MANEIISIISIIVNVAAIIIAPIISVKIAQNLQDKGKRRQDKMEIFKILMTDRIYNWTTYQSVNALNTIEIVFSDDENVCKQWKTLHDKLCVGNPTEMDFNKIRIERYKLLETMANSLGYKEKISWETIQNPYFPDSIVSSMLNQQEFQSGQLELVKFIKNLSAPNGGTNNGKDDT